MKTKLLTLCALSAMLTTAMAKSNEEQQVEVRYGFNEASNYATLLAALQRSFADYLANPADQGCPRFEQVQGAPRDFCWAAV